jgi:hypothetical protein
MKTSFAVTIEYVSNSFELIREISSGSFDHFSRGTSLNLHQMQEGRGFDNARTENTINASQLPLTRKASRIANIDDGVKMRSESEPPHPDKIAETTRTAGGLNEKWLCPRAGVTSPSLRSRESRRSSSGKRERFASASPLSKSRDCSIPGALAVRELCFPRKIDAEPEKKRPPR